MSIASGNISFNVVDINTADVARVFQTFLDRGSKITGVSLDDINLNVNPIPANPSTATLVDLLKAGMKLFDAVVWITAGRPNSHPLKRDPAIQQDTIPSMSAIASAVVYNFFFLLTQARYPMFSKEQEAKKDNKDAPRVPNFLTTILGMKESQTVYVNMLTSFPPEQFDPAWIKDVRFENFGQEIMARFGLGVAGYRLFAPFKLYTPKDNLSQALQDSYAFARAVAVHEPTWAIHPVTRDPAVLTARGNLNKNLGNLILECFDDAQIAEMVKARVLYATPVRAAEHNNYKTWAKVDDISGQNYIFRT